MKYILLTALALSQMTPCLAHEGHDKAFADKDALTTTTKCYAQRNSAFSEQLNSANEKNLAFRL